MQPMTHTDPVDAQICYLLVFPSTETDLPRTPEPIQRLKDAPYFETIDIDIRTVAHQVMNVDGIDVVIRRQVYDSLVQVAECKFRLPDALSAQALHARNRIHVALKTGLIPGLIEQGEPVEEYTVLCVQNIGCTPDEWIDHNGQALARFIRSQRQVFAPHEVEETLNSRVRFSDRELTLVDWEAAIVIAPEADFQSDVELLKIGEYQLLRYRLIDRLVERNLRAISQHFQEGARPSLLPNPSKRVLQEAIEQRLRLLLDFEKIDQGLLLIGDWYTAKLYQAIVDEFYLDEWKATVKSKLGSLESITQIVRDNFTFSWSRLLEMMQIAGWLLLLIGYFVLFLLDLRAYQ
jgi:hypothetical protein